jgi:hypothetical protein
MIVCEEAKPLFGISKSQHDIVLLMRHKKNSAVLKMTTKPFQFLDLFSESIRDIRADFPLPYANLCWSSPT